MRQESAYHVSGGLHGIGVSAVCALSEWMVVTVGWEGFLWKQEFRAGEAVAPAIKVRALKPGEKVGTTVTFKPDSSIFEPVEFSYEAAVQRARDIAYCVPNLNITVVDGRENRCDTQHIYSEDGMEELVKNLTSRRVKLHNIISGRGYFEVGAGSKVFRIEIDCAIQYVDSMERVIRLYVNTLSVAGGTPVRGLLHALQSSITNQVRNVVPFAEDELSGGLVAAVHVKHPNPSFASQNDTTLINEDAYTATAAVIAQLIRDSMRREMWEAITKKCEANRRKFSGG